MRSLSSYICSYILLITIFSHNLYGQKLAISANLNNANFKFDANTSINYSPIPSFGIEINYIRSIGRSKFDYKVGAAYNSFKVNGEFGSNKYFWNTQFVSLNNALDFTILSNKTNTFSLKPGIGCNILYLLDGSQSINQEDYSIKNHPEFAGIWIQPSVQLNAEWQINTLTEFVVGSSYSLAQNLNNSSSERVYLNNFRFNVGLQFIIK